MKSNTIVLEQGYKYIAVAFVIALLFDLFISDFIANIGYIITVVLVFVYRGSSRHIYENSSHILAPIDSSVIAIDHLKEEKSYKIYCKVTLCNNDIFYAPTDCSLKIESYKHGLNLNPNSYKASLLNGQIELDCGGIEIKLISGVCNGKIDKFEQKDYKQGEMIGLFFDGLVIITIEEKENLEISIGDKLKGGQTVLLNKC